MVRKSLSSMTFAGAIALLPMFAQVAHANTTEVRIPLQVLLAPEQGYDDNDNIQVVGRGLLPNKCYTVGRSRVVKSAASAKYQVLQYAIKDSSGICSDEANLPPHMKAPIPFVTEMNIGTLPIGSYDFEYASSIPGHAQSLTLAVGGATAMTIDSLPYAAVSTTMVPDIESASEDVKVSVSGVTTSSCTEVDPNVNVTKTGDTYVLFPVIKVHTGQICMEVMRPFLIEVNLGKMKPGFYLINTRAMNGRAVNRVVQIMK